MGSPVHRTRRAVHEYLKGDYEMMDNVAAFANMINGIERCRETLRAEIAELEEQERAARGVGNAAGQVGAGLTIDSRCTTDPAMDEPTG
jgi:hypothetical protein